MKGIEAGELDSVHINSENMIFYYGNMFKKKWMVLCGTEINNAKCKQIKFMKKKTQLLEKSVYRNSGTVKLMGF